MPKYIMAGEGDGTALKNTGGNNYYRNNGHWGCKVYVKKTGEMYIHLPGYPCHGLPVREITEEEWRLNERN